MGVLFSLGNMEWGCYFLCSEWGCQIHWGDAKYPRESGRGVPYSLGCQIPCDTGSVVVTNIMLYVRFSWM